MAFLKKTQLAILALIFIGGILVTTGCKKEGCTNPFAENFDVEADEDDGSCTLQRVKFLGTYSSVATCDSYSYNYSFTITASATGENLVVFNNLFDAGDNIVGTITDSAVSINDVIDGTTVTGTGSLIGNVLTMNVALSDGGYSENCIITATKQ